MEVDDEVNPTYEELADIDRDFEDIDTQIIAQQHILSAPIYERRAAAIKKIDNFWALCLEQAPIEIDQYIQPSDSEVFAACLENISVTRFEVPPSAAANPSNLGSLGQPRSVAFRFEFGENEWFEDRVLEKKFWYRRSKNGDTGLVSEPVKIHWKSAKDLSDGLTDAAYGLAEAVKKLGDSKKRFDLPEYKALVEKVNDNPEGSQSFFAWFAFKGGWVTEQENEQHNKEEAERRAKAKNGEKVEISEADEEEAMAGEPDDAEVFFMGEDLAVALSEDLWPNAWKYFISAQDDEDLSDLDVEDMEEDDDDEDDEDEEMDVQDIRNLVKGGAKGNTGPSPPKKQKR